MKIAYIMRGLPGSGKSTVARSVIGYTNKAYIKCIHSTDYYFMRKGEYHFDPTKLKYYHTVNLAAFEHDCEQGMPVVICDNTNIQKWEYENYVEVAKQYGYIVAIVQMPHPTVKECVKRNSHGVTKETIERMISQFES